MSAPTAETGLVDYPHLGFNPVPGRPDDVSAVNATLQQATATLKEAGGLLTQVEQSGSEIWQGAAGDAFRSHVDQELTKRLSTAQTSLEDALNILQGWYSTLVSHRTSAAQLDTEAAEAQQSQQQAQIQLEQAQANPDLQLAGRHFDTDAELQSAQNRLDAAVQGVDTASSALNDANGRLESIMRRARELQSEHEAVARRAAQAIEHAAHDLAPHKPGLFSRMWNDIKSAAKAVGDWVKNHLDAIHSVLSTISAVAGLLALITPPPIDVIAGAVALVAGAGALAVDAANPKFRHGISELLHGHFNKESLGAAMTGVGDVLSVVPGVGALGKTGVAAVKGLRAGEEAASVGMRAYDAAKLAVKDGGFMAKQLAKNPNMQKLVTTLNLPSLAPKVGAGAVDAMQWGAGVVWKTKGALSHVYKDVKEATS
ncbi:hypothetical protein [Streptacidiphilus monticola]|uniref:Integral membrane protein n=1 Tax=Streptacidiphilus monticola TaxID=2161674 RepID=A0ABW1G0P0_9ACTN